MKQLLKAEFFLHRKRKSLKLVTVLIFLVCLSTPLLMSLRWGERINLENKQLMALGFSAEGISANIRQDLFEYERQIEEALENGEMPDSELVLEYERKIEETKIYRHHNSELSKTSMNIITSYAGRFLNSYLLEKVYFNSLLVNALQNDYPTFMQYVGEYNKEYLDIQSATINKILEEGYTHEYNEYDVNMVNYLYFISNDLPMYFILIFAVFYAIRTIIDTSSPDAYKNVYTSPYSRLQINMAKIISTTVILLVIIVASITIVALAIGLIFGFSQFNYPLVFYNGGDIIQTTKLTLILKQLPLTIIIFINTILLAYLCAIVTDSSSLSLNICGIYIFVVALSLLPLIILKFTPLYYLTIKQTIYTNYNWIILALVTILNIIFLLLIKQIGSTKDLLGEKK